MREFRQLRPNRPSQPRALLAAGSRFLQLQVLLLERAFLFQEQSSLILKARELPGQLLLLPGERLPLALELVKLALHVPGVFRKLAKLTFQRRVFAFDLAVSREHRVGHEAAAAGARLIHVGTRDHAKPEAERCE